MSRTVPATVEARVRRMTRPERVRYLKDAGWRRLSSYGAQSWRAPDQSDRGFYTLAAAIRTALATELKS